MGRAYYYNNQRTKRKTWENWAFCSVCMNTLREKSRMSSRKSHQKKKDQEAMNKAKTLIALKSAQHQSQMIVEKLQKINQVKKVRVRKVLIVMTLRQILKQKSLRMKRHLL